MEPRQIEELLINMKNKTVQKTPDELMKDIRETRFFIPVNFKNEEALKEMAQLLENNEKVQVPPNANPVPVLIEDDKTKEQFMGIYTDQSQIPVSIRRNGIIQMPFDNIMQYSTVPEHKVTGVVINPFTQNFVMKINRAPQKLTPDQYHALARRNVEFALWPTGLYKKGKEFFDIFTEEYAFSSYKDQYKNGPAPAIPFGQQDVQLMNLGISPVLDLISVNLPEKNAPAGSALRLIMTWDSEKNRGGYYVITKGGKDSPARFLFLAPDGTSLEVGEVPPEGSGAMDMVLDYESKREG